MLNHTWHACLQCTFPGRLPRHGLYLEGACILAKETGGNAAGHPQRQTGGKTKGRHIVGELRVSQFHPQELCPGPGDVKKISRSGDGSGDTPIQGTIGDRHGSVEAYCVCQGRRTRMTGKLERIPWSSSPPSCRDKRTKALSPPVWIRMH